MPIKIVIPVNVRIDLWNPLAVHIGSLMSVRECQYTIGQLSFLSNLYERVNALRPNSGPGRKNFRWQDDAEDWWCYEFPAPKEYDGWILTNGTLGPRAVKVQTTVKWFTVSTHFTRQI